MPRAARGTPRRETSLSTQGDAVMREYGNTAVFEKPGLSNIFKHLKEAVQESRTFNSQKNPETVKEW